MDPSIVLCTETSSCSSFFVEAYFEITDKTKSLNLFASSALFNLATSTCFIIGNASQPDLILCDILAPMYRLIFTTRLKYTYFITFTISLLLTKVRPNILDMIAHNFLSIYRIDLALNNPERLIYYKVKDKPSTYIKELKSK